MRVEVLFVNEAGVMAETVEAPDGAAASEVLGLAGASLPAGAGLAVFGRRIEPSTKLHEGDRLEVAGALICDPKKVRRARAESQGDVRVVTCGRHGASPRLHSSLQPACVRHGKCRKGALADNLRANPLLQW